MADPTLVDSGGGGSSSGSASATTAATAVDDVIVMAVSADYYAAANVATPPNIAGCTNWVSRAQDSGGATAPHMRIWECTVTSAGAKTLTASSSNSDVSLVLMYAVLRDTPTLRGAAAAQTTTSSTSKTSPTVSPSETGLQLNFWCGFTSSSLSTPSGQTARYSRVLGSAFLMTSEPAGSGASRTSTSNNSSSWAAGTAVYSGGPSTVAKSGNDTATGAETGGTTAARSGSDSATGNDSGQVTVPRTGSDTAVGSESGSAGNGGSGSDTALGTETGASTATVTGTDPATTAETGTIRVTPSTTPADSASGADGGTATTATTGGDAATGTNPPGSSTAAVTGADTAAGTNLPGSSTAALTGSDGAGTTETGKITIPGRDTSSGAETLTELYGRPVGADSGIGADGGYIEARDGDIVISLFAIVDGTAVPLPDYQELTLAPARNGPGSITLRYPAAGQNFDVLRDNTVGADRDLEVEIWTIGNPTGALRGYLQEGGGDSVKEGRAASWTFTGGFLELRMGEARVWPQPLVGEATLGDPVTVPYGSVTPAQWSRLRALGYTGTAGDNAEQLTGVPQKVLAAVKANAASIPVLADPKREAKFVAQTPGAIVLFLLAQARARGALTDITIGFTAERDSNGSPWPSLVTTTVSPGATIEQVLNLLAQLGRAEWSMAWTGTDRQLNLWVAGQRGVDKSVGLRPVVLRAGRNLAEAPTKWSVRSSPTAMGAAGAEGYYAETSDGNALARRGRRIEGWTTSQNLATTDAVQAYAQRRLSTTSDGTLEVTHGLALLPGEPRPLISFDVGDWVYSATGTSLDRYRVVEWSLTINAARSMSATVTLNDAFLDEVVRQRQQLDALSTGETVVGTSPQPVNNTPPSPPTGLLVSSGAFNEGIDAYAVVLAAWTAPTTNTDGTALTSLAGYRVEWTEYAQPTKWRAAATVDGSTTQAQFTTATDLPILVRVAAYKTSGAQSTWTTLTAPHTTEVDATPPPQTSAITGSVYLGVVTWTWDGKSADGADMFAAAPDFDHAELHMSTGSNFTPTAATLLDKLYGKGAYSYAKMPDGSPIGYGVTVYARLVPVDVRGNRQPAASVQGSATPSRLLGDDFGAGVVGSAALADASVIRAKIGTAAVGDLQVESVGVGKLTAGLLQASMVIGTGRIATGTSGARVEIDTAGVRLYDASGAINVQLKTSDGSAMVAGEYRTSLTSGKRLVFNPNGSSPDEIRFYPSSTNQYGRMKTITSVATGYENQAGMVVKGYSARSDGQSGEVSAFPSYAALAWGNEMEGGAVTARISASQAENFLGGNRTRITAPTSSGDERYYGVLSVGADMGTYNGTPWGSNPTTLTFTASESGAGNAQLLQFQNNSGIQFDRGNGEGIVSFVKVQGGLCRIQAANYALSSSRTIKRRISPLRDDTFDPLAVVASVRARTYQLRNEVGRRQVGLIAEELPDLLRSPPAAPGDAGPVADDGKGGAVDLYALVSTVWEGLAQLKDQVDNLTTPRRKAA